jgi:hypothetical protein
MPERLPMPSVPPFLGPATDDEPPPDVADFIRYCHGRRPAGWPEIYDEMCAVAARGEFKGWDHDQFAARGLTFALPEMQQLSQWVRAVLDREPEALEAEAIAVAAG